MNRKSNRILRFLLLGMSFPCLILFVSCGIGEGATGPTSRESSSELGDTRGATSSDNDSPLGSSSASDSNTSTFAQIETEAFEKVNSYRASKALANLTWNDEIADIARIHSENMANGLVAFSHDGFEERSSVLSVNVGWSKIAENVAYNNFSNAAEVALRGWISSPNHEANMTDDFIKSGIGVAKSTEGYYYFTQIFIK